MYSYRTETKYEIRYKNYTGSFFSPVKNNLFIGKVKYSWWYLQPETGRFRDLKIEIPKSFCVSHVHHFDEFTNILKPSK